MGLGKSRLFDPFSELGRRRRIEHHVIKGCMQIHSIGTQPRTRSKEKRSGSGCQN